ncbi:hypothetical protein ACFX2C_006529 [Malus domestica]
MRTHTDGPLIHCLIFLQNTPKLYAGAAGTKRWTMNSTKTPPGALFRVFRLLLSADVVSHRGCHKHNSQTQDCIALPGQPSEKPLSYI